MSVSEPTASVEVALTHAMRLLATDPVLAGEQASAVRRVAGDRPVAMFVLDRREAQRELPGDLDAWTLTDFQAGCGRSAGNPISSSRTCSASAPSWRATPNARR